jgi:hypothetical protein
MDPEPAAAPPPGQDQHENERTTSQPSLDEFLKQAQGKVGAEGLQDDRRHGREAFSVYIDARSGGAYFAGEAHVGRDVVGRDQRTTTPEDRPDRSAMVTVVAEDTVRKIRAVYEQPEPYRLARRVLETRRLAILFGQHHVGKWATALYLLSETEPGGISEINPDIDLDGLLEFGFDYGRRYVVDALRPEVAERLTTFVMNRLSATLESQSSQLVLTVDARAALPRETVGDYLVTWNETPNQRVILERHLNWYLTEAKAGVEARELLQVEGLDDLLENHLAPGEIDRLAELLSQSASGEMSAEEALQHFEVQAQQDVERWFTTHTDLNDCSFMIAVAVLNGASYQAVANAAARLQALLEPLELGGPEADRPTPPPVFARTRTQRLKEVGACLKSGYHLAEFGVSPVELVELENVSMQLAVVHHVWHEHDSVRAPLLSWLEELGRHRSFEVSNRAAAAVGKLAEYDFGHLRAEVLLPWANSEDQLAREAAAAALGVPAWGSEVAPQVIGLLHHWSTLQGNLRLRWTAAAAYGGLAGLRFPELALYGLRLILDAEDPDLLGICSRSMLYLFDAGAYAPGLHQLVLETLASWSTERKPDSVLTLSSLGILLRLAYAAGLEPARTPGQYWPTVLWLFDRAGPERTTAVALLRQALASKPTGAAALDVIHRWTSAADANDDVASALESLLLELSFGSDGRERELLRAAFIRWTSDPDYSSPFAERMRSLLL